MDFEVESGKEIPKNAPYHAMSHHGRARAEQFFSL
jgi:hypothetical protein